MAKRIVTGKSAGVPQPIGPYSNGVVAEGTRILFIAGQIAWDAEGKMVGKGDLGEQYRQIMRNIQRIVEEAGGSMADVCKVVNYVTRDLQKGDIPYAEVSAARKKFIPHDWPVSTLVEVTSLMDPDALVEVDAIAVLD